MKAIDFTPLIINWWKVYFPDIPITPRSLDLCRFLIQDANARLVKNSIEEFHADREDVDCVYPFHTAIALRKMTADFMANSRCTCEEEIDNALVRCLCDHISPMHRVPFKYQPLAKLYIYKVVNDVLHHLIENIAEGFSDEAEELGTKHVEEAILRTLGPKMAECAFINGSRSVDMYHAGRTAAKGFAICDDCSSVCPDCTSKHCDDSAEPREDKNVSHCIADHPSPEPNSSELLSVTADHFKELGACPPESVNAVGQDNLGFLAEKLDVAADGP